MSNLGPSEHVILVAITVQAETREEAERYLHNALPAPGSHDPIEDWWIAEDERYDRSDNASAVFVPPGTSQKQARQILKG